MRPRQIIAAFLLLIATTGCTATTKEIRFSDGTIDYLITCDARLGWNICYDKANEVCPSGYRTIFEDPGSIAKSCVSPVSVPKVALTEA